MISINPLGGRFGHHTRTPHTDNKLTVEKEEKMAIFGIINVSVELTLLLMVALAAQVVQELC